MKKLMILAMALFALQLTAQQGNQGKKKQGYSKMQERTPEESANLKAKKMTLNLDLSEKQQEQVYQLFLQNEKEREQIRQAHQEQAEKPSRTEIENARLDKQIEMKKKMKNILNEEQYAKWEKNMENRRGDFQKKKGKRKMAPKE